MATLALQAHLVFTPATMALGPHTPVIVMVIGSIAVLLLATIVQDPTIRSTAQRHHQAKLSAILKAM